MTSKITILLVSSSYSEKIARQSPETLRLLYPENLPVNGWLLSWGPKEFSMNSSNLFLNAILISSGDFLSCFKNFLE